LRERRGSGTAPPRDNIVPPVAAAPNAGGLRLLGRAMACELRLVVVRKFVLQICVPELVDRTCPVAAPASSGQSQPVA
jgi:hypothetical protein